MIFRPWNCARRASAAACFFSEILEAGARVGEHLRHLGLLARGILHALASLPQALGELRVEHRRLVDALHQLGFHHPGVGEALVLVGHSKAEELRVVVERPQARLGPELQAAVLQIVERDIVRLLADAAGGGREQEGGGQHPQRGAHFPCGSRKGRGRGGTRPRACGS